MKALIASAAVLLALSGPAAIAQQKQPDTANQQKQSQQQQTQQKTPAAKAQDQVAQRRHSRLNVTSADHLVGDKLRDLSGSPAGEIEYVMIDTDTGKVDYIIAGSADRFDLNGQLAAIPWSAVSITPRSADVVNLNISAEQVRKSPRFTSDRLFELTEPATVSQVTTYYSVPQSGSTQPVSGSSGANKSQSGQLQDQAQQNQKTDSGSAILVGRGVTTVILPPLFKTADAIRGTEVELASGEDIGEIDKLMIDAENGRIAYVLLAKGGFLGLGEDWVPVPYESLRFDPAEPRFVLTIDEDRLKQIPVLQKEEHELPTRISKSQLKMLYNHFGVKPYWQG